VIIGHAPYPALARSFVATYPRIDAFLSRHRAPYIAKIYRAAPADLEKSPDSPGSIQLWYPAP
jgi:hypothetical protein